MVSQLDDGGRWMDRAGGGGGGGNNLKMRLSGGGSISEVVGSGSGGDGGGGDGGSGVSGGGDGGGCGGDGKGVPGGVREGVHGGWGGYSIRQKLMLGFIAAFCFVHLAVPLRHFVFYEVRRCRLDPCNPC